MHVVSYTWLLKILQIQEIKKDKDKEGTKACKIALYRTFLQCGVKTWEQVIKALENSGDENIAKQVKMQLFQDFN